jgi:DNA-binding response OmpR family regulator
MMKSRLAEALGIFFREAEFDVESFYDGPSALRIASQRPPDILISDIDMPRMDGITLAKALREQCPNCEVILMSGTLIVMKGADSFTILAKPFPLSQLLLLVESLLG